MLHPLAGQESEMSINIGPPAVEELRPRITVIGVGGAGGNAIANMINAGIEGVDFVVANTDAQALNNSIAEHRIQLGPDITQGWARVRGPKWAGPPPKKRSPRSSAR
jgi:cell division GTPase FtsZ